MWNGNGFEKREVKREFENAVLTLELLDKPPFALNLLYGRECYLVTSEIRDDFYREF